VFSRMKKVEIEALLKGRKAMESVTFDLPNLHRDKIWIVAEKYNCSAASVFRLAVEEFLIRYEEIKDERK